MDKPKGLYYIIHLDNLQSILERGILSHNQVQGIEHHDIHDAKILRRRKELSLDGEIITMQDYVNLYFQPRNAMLFRLIQTVGKEKLAVLRVQPAVIEEPGTIFSDRNAAASQAQFFTDVDDLEELDVEVFRIGYWGKNDDRRQRMMAEVLVPRPIREDEIVSIYVAAPPDDQLKELAGDIDIIHNTQVFFGNAYEDLLDNM